MEEQIVSYMKSHSKTGVCSREELMSVISPKSSINREIRHSSRVIEWGQDELILTEKLIMRASDKRTLFVYITKACSAGECTADSLFQKMKPDRRMFSIIKGKQVDSPEKLAVLIAWLFPEITLAAE